MNFAMDQKLHARRDLKASRLARKQRLQSIIVIQKLLVF